MLVDELITVDRVDFLQLSHQFLILWIDHFNCLVFFFHIFFKPHILFLQKFDLSFQLVIHNAKRPDLTLAVLTNLFKLFPCIFLFYDWPYIFLTGILMERTLCILFSWFPTEVLLFACSLATIPRNLWTFLFKVPNCLVVVNFHIKFAFVMFESGIGDEASLWFIEWVSTKFSWDSVTI